MDALVLRSQHQTIVITRSLVPARAAQMRQTSGGELRGALDVHLSGDSVDAQLLSTFWLAAGGPVLSVLRPAELVAAVVAAVEAGRLRAYVFKEPAYISQASHQALRGEADRAARSPTRPGARAMGRQLSVAQMGVAERFVEVFHRTVPRVGPELGRQLRTLVENPTDLAFMVGTVVILVQLHAVAAGEVIDGIVLTAIIACAVIEGMGVFQATLSALEAAANLVDFLTTTLAARDDKDLDRAAEKLAAGLSAVGVGILSAALARIAGRFTDSLKKAGGQRKVETVSREEMAGKGRGSAEADSREGGSRPRPSSGLSETFLRLREIDAGGVKAQRISEGTGKKIAVIGRSMGDGETPGVKKYAKKLKQEGYDVEIFDGPQISPGALSEWRSLRDKYGIIPDDVIVNSKIYKENRLWIQGLKSGNYSVIDIGDPNKAGKSIFYDMERDALSDRRWF